MKKIILFAITILAFSWSFSFAENSVIELSSAEDLQLLAEHPDGDFVLTDDVYFEPDTEWVPPVFRGHLNGNGYTIYNVHNTGLCPETRTVYDGNYKEYDGAFAGLFGILDGVPESTERCLVATAHDEGLEHVRIDLVGKAEDPALPFGARVDGPAHPRLDLGDIPADELACQADIALYGFRAVFARRARDELVRCDFECLSLRCVREFCLHGLSHL